MNEPAMPRVRLARQRDLMGVCAIVNYSIEHTAFNFRSAPQDVDEWRRDWNRLHARYPWLVATTTDDRVIGAAYAAPWNGRTAYDWTVEATVYVESSHHRRAVGSVLYRELLSRLCRQGFRSAVAVIALPNDPSVRLHERHGFVQVGQLADAGFKMGGWHDVGFWQRKLSGRRDGMQPPLPVEDRERP